MGLLQVIAHLLNNLGSFVNGGLNSGLGSIGTGLGSILGL
jgi:hypothetical protein